MTTVVGINEMQQQFSQLLRAGESVTNPQSPAESYANARLSEFAGDFSSAREHYQSYFQHPCDCLDPHLRYLSMLEPQLGTEDARQKYLEVTQQSASQASQLMRVLFEEHQTRTAKLDALFQQTPDCGPVAYFLGCQFSAPELGVRSLKQKKQERTLLEQFQNLDQQGKVTGWFFEPEFVDSWRADVDERQSALTKAAYLFEDPVNLRWNERPGGWTGTILVSEIALELFWKPKNSSELKSTGTLKNRRYSTGHHHPRPYFEIPKVNRFTEFEVHYKDVGGEMIGPFFFGLDPVSADILSSKQLLNVTRSGWVSFRNQEQDRLYLHFTHLFNHKNSLKSIKYGLDNGHLDRELDLSARKMTGIPHIDKKMPYYVEIPTATQHVTIELEFKDGDRSESTIRRP